MFLHRNWLDHQERNATAKHERLESELHASKANLVKEAIRQGNNDLGDFYYARGDLQVGRPGGSAATSFFLHLCERTLRVA
jgi:predicted DNA-binding protein